MSLLSSVYLQWMGAESNRSGGTIHMVRAVGQLGGRSWEWILLTHGI